MSKRKYESTLNKIIFVSLNNLYIVNNLYNFSIEKYKFNKVIVVYDNFKEIIY